MAFKPRTEVPGGDSLNPTKIREWLRHTELHNSNEQKDVALFQVIDALLQTLDRTEKLAKSNLADIQNITNNVTGSSENNPFPLFGLDGQDGEDGLDGLIGPRGATGASGSIGINGLNGNPGQDGLDGEDGEDSYIPGPQGLQGNTGASGAVGARGVDGLTGIDGIDGEDGLDSLIPGPRGVSGSNGATGATGLQGPIGPSGLDAEEAEFPYIIPGPKGDTGASLGLIVTSFTKDLGVAQRAGTFDITGLAGLTIDKVVLIIQTKAIISSKGDARDESEMDMIVVTGYVVDANTIRASWFSSNSSVVVGTYAFAYAVSG